MKVVSRKLDDNEQSFLLLLVDIFLLKRAAKRTKSKTFCKDLIEYATRNLAKDGIRVKFTNDDLIFNGISIKEFADPIINKKRLS